MRISSLLPVLLLAAPLSAQTGALDQSSPFGNASFNLGSATLTWQAQVRAGIPGTLEGFRVNLRGNAGATVDFAVRLGDAWSVNPTLWTGTATTAGTGTWEMHFMDCSSAGIALNSGDTFVIEMFGSTGVNAQGEYIAPPGIPPYAEPLYLNQNVHSNGGWRIGFESWMLTGPPPPTMAVTGNCPGAGQVDLTNMTPGGRIAIAAAASQGASVVPGGSCAGSVIGLLNPQIKIVAFADGGGSFSSPANLPAAACGSYYAQGFDLGSCTATNVVAL